MAILKIFDEEDNKWKVVVTGRDGKDGKDGQQISIDEFITYLNTSKQNVEDNIGIIYQLLEELRQEIVDQGSNLPMGSSLDQYAQAMEEFITTEEDLGFSLSINYGSNSYARMPEGFNIENHTKALNLPTQQGGVNVTEIADEAFMGMGLSRINVSHAFTENVNKIGNGAFKDNNLRDLPWLPRANRVGGLIIGDNAFENNDMGSITLGAGVKSIGHNAFAGNPLSAVEIIGNHNVRYEDDSFPPGTTIRRI